MPVIFRDSTSGPSARLHHRSRGNNNPRRTQNGGMGDRSPMLVILLRNKAIAERGRSASLQKTQSRHFISPPS